MKIDLGTGTPVFVSPRRIGGVEIIQGRARVKLTDAELIEMCRVLNELSTNDADQGQEKTTRIARV